MNSNNEPIRVLHIVGRMDRGGIETMLMNLYRKIDRSQVQFDFLAHYGREATYNREIRALGGRIYEMPALRDETHVYYWRLLSYIKALHRFFREHPEYQIIHGHMTNTASIYIPIARKYGVRRAIAHSHSTFRKAGTMGIVTDILQRPVCKYATDYFACSNAAAHRLYPKRLIDEGKVRILPNAIDAEAFRYDPALRQEVRKELGIGEETVIGCVGRFRPEKNQTFLLDILAAMSPEQNVRLLFVGDGPCEAAVKARCSRMGLADRVLFLGQRGDIPGLMQAMDVFCLPSLWEGLPLVGVEAQAAGLPVVASDSVTKETDLFGNVSFLSLDAPASQWAQALLQAALLPRKDTLDALRRAGYDLNTTVPWLQGFYLNLHKV